MGSLPEEGPKWVAPAQTVFWPRSLFFQPLFLAIASNDTTFEPSGYTENPKCYFPLPSWIT